VIGNTGALNERESVDAAARANCAGELHDDANAALAAAAVRLPTQRTMGAFKATPAL
jgi:hypothetical protein